MSYSLTNDKGEAMEMNHFGWPKLLEVARAFGWNPCGTLLPTQSDPPPSAEGFEPMDYLMDDGRRIEVEDALALATAIERASQEPALSEGSGSVPPPSEVEAFMRQFGIVPLGQLRAMTPLQWLQQQRPETIAECVVFLRGGMVTIS